MKHILPIVTLTTLAAAASAQAASGLNYNRVGVTVIDGQTSLSAEYLLGGNVLISAVAGNTYTSHAEDALRLGIGYVFKNVAAGVDATVGLTAGLSRDQSSSATSLYSINLRRSLSEILPGLEAAVTYATTGSDTRQNELVQAYGVYVSEYWNLELAYNINSKIQVAYARLDGDNDAGLNSFILRYNF